MSKKPPTKDEKEWFTGVSELNCCICQMPAEIHHRTVRGWQ